MPAPACRRASRRISAAGRTAPVPRRPIRLHLDRGDPEFGPALSPRWRRPRSFARSATAGATARVATIGASGTAPTRGFASVRATAVEAAASTGAAVGVGLRLGDGVGRILTFADSRACRARGSRSYRTTAKKQTMATLRRMLGTAWRFMLARWGWCNHGVLFRSTSFTTSAGIAPDLSRSTRIPPCGRGF